MAGRGNNESVLSLECPGFDESVWSKETLYFGCDHLPMNALAWLKLIRSPYLVRHGEEGGTMETVMGEFESTLL